VNWRLGVFSPALANRGESRDGNVVRQFRTGSVYSKMNENILLVEDEQALRMTLSDRLQSEVTSWILSRWRTSLEKATTLPFDLIILDIMLPRRSGLDICRDIRLAGLATRFFSLLLVAKTVDKVVGLKLGADDYVTKPFDTLELMARIEALLRRAPTRTGQGILQFGQSVSIFRDFLRAALVPLSCGLRRRLRQPRNFSSSGFSDHCCLPLRRPHRMPSCRP